MDENPHRAEEFEAAARQIAAALHSGAETTINITGDQVKLRSKEEGGFAIASSDGNIAADLFEPAESRPSGYPHDLPFIAGEAVAFSSTDGSVSLTWWSARDPAAILSQLDLESRAQGYERHSYHVRRNESAAMS
jgi:hypothetical protein